MQQLLVLVILLEYMPGKWFRIVEEEDDEEEGFYSYNVIIVNIDSRSEVFG